MIRNAFMGVVVCLIGASFSVSAAESFESDLAEHIRQHTFFPALAQMEKQEDYVVVHISVDGSGNIRASSLVRPSAHAVLNEAAEQLLSNASPVPEPPAAHLVNERADYVFPITYSIQQTALKKREAYQFVQAYIDRSHKPDS